ncbi:MAG: cupin [Bacteroidetes bacterium]|nr:MAG: cupin [Bacteroidota bacterium]
MQKPENKIRRVVTGHSEEGKSVIISDSIIEGISLGGGKDFIQLWGKDSITVHPDNGLMEEKMDWFPEAGGHRFFVWVVPPKTTNSDGQKSKAEIDALLPGFLGHFEQDNPGMHTTNSVDCTYLISGSIILELDDNKEVELNEGDSIVQNGTRHRWHNRGEIPAVLITTCIGSERK